MSLHSSRSPLGANVLAASSPVRGLLTESDRIGGIYRLQGFREALVVTNDEFVFRAHGVPQHCFLLAAVEGFAQPDLAGSHDPDDEEVLLLRVTDTAALPDEADGQHALVAAARRSGARRFVAQSFAGWPYAREGGWSRRRRIRSTQARHRRRGACSQPSRHLERAVMHADGIEGLLLRYGTLYGSGTSIAGSGGHADLAAGLLEHLLLRFYRARIACR